MDVSFANFNILRKRYRNFDEEKESTLATVFTDDLFEETDVNHTMENNSDWDFSEKCEPSKEAKMHTENHFASSSRGKVYTGNKDREKHVMTHNDEKLHTCDTCGRKFFYESILIKHKEVHNEVKSFSCDICGDKFRTKDDTKVHRRVHTGTKLFMSGFCGTTILQTVPHEYISTDNEKTTCGTSFKERNLPLKLVPQVVVHQQKSRDTQCSEHDAMREHIEDDLNSVETLQENDSQQAAATENSDPHFPELFICKYCGSELSEMEDYKKHLLTHIGKKLFDCYICGKWFHWKSHTSRQRHLMTHCKSKSLKPAVKNNVNDITNNSESKSVKQHSNNHSKNVAKGNAHKSRKQFICNVCGKKFTTAERYKQHGLIHIDEASYNCEACGKHFKYKRTLSMHLQTHHFESEEDTTLDANTSNPKETMQNDNPRIHPMSLRTSRNIYHSDHKDLAEEHDDVATLNVSDSISEETMQNVKPTALSMDIKIGRSVQHSGYKEVAEQNGGNTALNANDQNSEVNDNSENYPINLWTSTQPGHKGLKEEPSGDTTIDADNPKFEQTRNDNSVNSEENELTEEHANNASNANLEETKQNDNLRVHPMHLRRRRKAQYSEYTKLAEEHGGDRPYAMHQRSRSAQHSEHKPTEEHEGNTIFYTNSEETIHDDNSRALSMQLGTSRNAHLEQQLTEKYVGDTIFDTNSTEIIQNDNPRDLSMHLHTSRNVQHSEHKELTEQHDGNITQDVGISYSEETMQNNNPLQPINKNVNEYINIHKEDKPFICKVCGVKCSQQEHCNQHVLTDSDERLYSKVTKVTYKSSKSFNCDECGKKFASAYYCSRHVLTHTGERPYSCDICDKRFTRKDHVSRHLRTHT